MENMYKYPVSLRFDEECLIKCYIDDEDALIEDENDFIYVVNRIKKGDYKDFYIDLTLNTILGVGKFDKITELLSYCYGCNGNIDIFTSARNIGLCLSLLPYEVNNVNVFIDDYEVREFLKSMPIDKIKFNCHLSEKYLLNLDETSFKYVCQQENFKFDREDICSKRACLRGFWQTRLHGLDNVDKISDEEKITIVLDYIDRNIAYVEHCSANSSPLQMIKDGQCDSKGMAKISSFLLDNYLARVDCHKVDGKHNASNVDMSWIVTKVAGQKYGHCLVTNKRFKKLSNYGYVDGKISLDPMHFSRKEFMASVDDYAEMGDSQYLYLTYCLDDKVKSFYYEDKQKKSNPVYVKKNTSLY